MSSPLGSFARNLVGLFLLTVSALALAQKIPADGTDFRSLRQPVAVEVPAGKIEVIEFFWYGCPHCNTLEPSLVDWTRKQAPDVVVRHVPVAFNDSLVPHQRLYYTLEALGKETELRPKVFAAIHREKNMLNKEELMADWAAKNGIDRKKFVDTYNSFGVQTKTRRAAQLAESFGIDGVPSIAVAGKVVIPNSPAVLTVADYLVARERTKK